MQCTFYTVRKVYVDGRPTLTFGVTAATRRAAVERFVAEYDTDKHLINDLERYFEEEDIAETALATVYYSHDLKLGYWVIDDRAESFFGWLPLTVVCPQCGKSFPSPNRSVIYCSNECAFEVWRESTLRDDTDAARFARALNRRRLAS